MQHPQKNMNQRASHFTLGTTSVPSASVYTQDYTKKRAEGDPTYKVMDPFKGNSINPPGPASFATTNNAMYKNWGTGQSSSLDKQKLKDLRSHHFNLGTYNPSQNATTNQQYFNPKEISSDALKNREQSKNRMRAHYHDFKQQDYTNFKSTYDKEFGAKQLTANVVVKPEIPPNAIVFGNHHLPMMTTNNADFNKKQAPPSQVKSTLQQSSSLVLGDKSQSMQTTNQLYYDQKPLVKSELPESTMKELRAAHFSLGGAGSSYETEMSRNFQAMPVQNSGNSKNALNYESGTWVPKDAKFEAQTTNKRELPTRQVEPYQKVQPKTKSQMMLGNQGTSYATQFSQNFNSKPISYVGQVEKPQDNVTTGFEKGTYQTEHRANFKSRNLQDAKVNIDIAAKSKVDHFQIGSGAEPNLTVYQDEYRRDQQRKSKFFHKDNSIA